MYIHINEKQKVVNTKVKDSYFREVAEKVKSFGFDVYAPENIFEGDSRYGYVTDGKGIIYFQIDDLFGLQWSVECIPSRETGSGVRLNVNLSKEGISEALRTPYGKPYADFASFRKEHEQWRKLIKL